MRLLAAGCSRLPKQPLLCRGYAKQNKTARLPRRRPSQENKIRYNYNDNPFDTASEGQAAEVLPLLNANQLAVYSHQPRTFQALTRDFIHDSLYNPNYGYFTQQAVIFDSVDAQVDIGKGFDFNKIRNAADFDKQVAARYGEIEGSEAAAALPGTSHGSARQIWHTPSELFKPWYARAVARFLVDAHRSKQEPNSDLIIFEIGAGNGTLMQGVLDYLQECEPDLYDKVSYTTIEVSPRLADLQRKRGAKHSERLRIIQSDILECDYVEERPCFVLAFEVLDNLAHDLIRFTKDPANPPTPMQCTVTVSSSGDFGEQYTPVNDPLIADFLEAYSQTNLPRLGPSPSPLLRKLMAAIPFSANLSPPIFLPTQMFALLRKLKSQFPRHQMLLSDFDALPDAVEGLNGPRVQTRYLGDTVPCTTYLVSPGYFDIFFPTDFKLMRALCGQVSGASYEFHHTTHKDFLKKWAEVDQAKLLNGDNPMLEYYANVSFAWTTATEQE